MTAAILRQIDIAKKSKATFHSSELFERDIEGGISSCRPGEWVIINFKNGQKLGMVNPFVTRGAPVRLVDYPLNELDDIEDVIVNLLHKALARRRLWSSLDKGARLIYGAVDGLPGLIVDSYLNAVLIQINTAGLDHYRNLILSTLEKELDTACYLIDRRRYREAEGLPVYQAHIPLEYLEVNESGLNYRLPMKLVQKVGHYYDHRPNRLLLEQSLRDWQGRKQTGADLFCYMGAWGLGALRAGIEKMDFVDQGDFGDVIEEHLRLNNFTGRGKFKRQDVFHYLQTLKEEGKALNLIISDPPAFSKSASARANALRGYQKLHTRIMDVLAPDGLLAVGSCTHGVSHEELDRTVMESAKKSGRGAFLIQMGSQGADHPMSGLQSSEFYIKYLLYRVE